MVCKGVNHSKISAIADVQHFHDFFAKGVNHSKISAIADSSLPCVFSLSGVNHSKICYRRLGLVPPTGSSGCKSYYISAFADVITVKTLGLICTHRRDSPHCDIILSPVARDGLYFCSTDEANKGRDAQGNWVSKLPVDADANGAYHIALKGLYLLRNPETKKIENEKWLQFMVEKPYLE